MASEHTAKAFDSDLQELTRLVAEMGGLAERMIVESVDALIRRDVALGKRVVAADAEIDSLQRVIEERAVLTIARRQPMAVDLREIVGAMRVATDLERIGDLAKNMGKRVAALESDFQPLKLIRGLEHMTDLVQSQVKSVLDAYAAHDLPAAMTVWKGDEEVDAICTSLFRELLTYMMEDPRNISFCIHLMFCAKNIERIGDHATNIAETVFYMIEGQQILDKRPKGDMTTFAPPYPETETFSGNRLREERVKLEKAYAYERAHSGSGRRGSADHAVALQPRRRRLRRRNGRARRRRRHPAEGARSRPDRARLDAAGPVRDRAVPPLAGAAGDQAACRSSC